VGVLSLVISTDEIYVDQDLVCANYNTKAIMSKVFGSGEVVGLLIGSFMVDVGPFRYSRHEYRG
jgi:hydroxyethylthiazole kinase-like sugar kinase family protein